MTVNSQVLDVRWNLAHDRDERPDARLTRFETLRERSQQIPQTHQFVLKRSQKPFRGTCVCCSPFLINQPSNRIFKYTRLNFILRTFSLDVKHFMKCIFFYCFINSIVHSSSFLITTSTLLLLYI